MSIHAPVVFEYTGSAADIQSAFIAHLVEQQGDAADKMWQGRAFHMLDSALPAIIEHCARQAVALTSDTLRRLLAFESMTRMSKSPRLASSAKLALQGYLNFLPGFNSGVIAEAKIQHGFVVMSLTPAFETDPDSTPGL